MQSVPDGLVKKATLLLVQRQEEISVSLLQRHLVLGYRQALTLMSTLASRGVVSAPDGFGKRHLRDSYINQILESMTKKINPKVAEDSLREFEGCDGSDAGSAENPYVWLFGIEHGALPAAGAEVKASDDTYSIDEQLTYNYNRQAFKLLASMRDEPVAQYEAFARREQPFVKDSQGGYFKGNIYPYACQNVDDWPADTQSEVGLTKEEYRAWCDENRIPTIRTWVTKYQPKLFIGVGLTAAHLYSRAVFGTESPLEEIRFTAANGQGKRVLRATEGWRKLVVIPHLSGGVHGLNSDDSVQKAGRILAEVLAS